MSKTEIFDK